MVSILFIRVTLIQGSLSLDCHISLQTLENGDILPSGRLNTSSLEIPEEHYERLNSTHFRTCVCSATNCLRKCCPHGQNFNANRRCEEQDNATMDIRVHDANYTWLHSDVEKSLKLVHGNTCSRGRYPLNSKHPDDKFFLMENGDLHLPNQKHMLYLEEFCIEKILFPNGTTDEHVVLVCFPEEKEERSARKYLHIGGLISIPFLLLTLAVYWYLPELRNTHGKSLMCYVSSLIVGYVFLSIMNLQQTEGLLCDVSGPAMQFSFLASFFWLTVMNFDIWMAFRHLTQFQQLGPDPDSKLAGQPSDISTGILELNSGHKGVSKVKFRNGRNTFLYYSIFAWGVPALICLITVVIDHSPPDIFSHIPQPRLGMESCWLNGWNAQLMYFDGPAAIILFCNLCLFVATACQIYLSRKQAEALEEENSRRKTERNKRRFFLYVKLFLVMGVNWTLEIIGWATDGFNYIWLLPDISSSLQGIFIFIIFVGKARIKKVIAKWRNGDSESSTVTSTARTSRNSSPVLTMNTIQVSSSTDIN